MIILRLDLPLPPTQNLIHHLQLSSASGPKTPTIFLPSFSSLNELTQAVFFYSLQFLKHCASMFLFRHLLSVIFIDKIRQFLEGLLLIKIVN